jgi:hypothetical protein
MIRPYQYPLLIGAVPATGAPQTVNRTVSVTIPPNSSFIWTHTLNATVQTASGGTSIRTQLFDSVNGPLFNVSTEIANIAGAIYQTFVAAPRAIRPFPLPETYTFDQGAVITATYTVILTPNGGDPSFGSVGIILCGYRIIGED